MQTSLLLERVERQIASNIPTKKDDPAGVFLFREHQPSEFEAMIYEPVVCLVLQGEKEISVGEQTVTLRAGECVVVSHDLPVLARITRASERKPYLSLVIRLDISVLRSLYDEVGNTCAESEAARSIEVAPVDAATVSVLARYLDALKNATEKRVLLPLIRKELHFRLFMSKSGGMLRSLLRRDSHASNIARAIKSLRENFRDRLDIGDLARAVGMSASSFHKHFKSVTMTTPLQYQKDLRLTEARRLLREGRVSVSGAAFEVGYESPSQFSREYTRKFGTAPRLDQQVA